MFKTYLSKSNIAVAASLVALGAASPALAEASKPKAQPAVVRELDELRTPTTRQYLLEDGRIRAEIAGAPTHYRASDGTWQPIAPHFASGPRGLEAAGTPIAVGIEGDAIWIGDASDWAIVADPLTIEGASETLLPLGPWHSISSAEIGRDRVGSDVHEQLRLEAGGVRRELVIARPPSAGLDITVSTTLSIPEGWSLRQRTTDGIQSHGPGYPVLVDASGKVRFQFLEPSGRDSTLVRPGEEAPSTTGKLDVVPEGGSVYRFRATFSSAWLRQPGRQYPVYLDPSLSTNATYGGELYQDAGLTWLFSESPTKTIVLSGNRAYTGHPSAGYLSFDVSAIRPGVTVTALDIQPYVSFSNNTTTEYIYAYDAGGQAPYGSLSQTEIANLHTDLRGGEYFGLVGVGYNDVGLHTISAGTAALRELTMRILDGQFVVGIKSDGDGSGDLKWRNVDTDLSQLVVTYDPMPNRHIVISEVNTGAVDWIELYNYGYDTDITGWDLQFRNSTTTLAVWNVPSFTLKRHAFVQILAGAGTNSATQLYTGQFPNWTSSSAGEVALSASSGLGIDYVQWRNSPDVLIAGQHWTGGSPTGNGDVIRRYHDADTDQAYDWSIGGTASPLALNTGSNQVGTRPRHHLVINEITTSPTDTIEIVNLAPVAQNLENWHLVAYENEILSFATGNYQFPTGTWINSGGVLRINDTAGIDTADDVYTGDSINWTSTSPAEVYLYQTQPGSTTVGTNYGADYVCWNDPQSIHWPTGAHFTGADILPDGSTTLTRIDDLDSDSTDDWLGRTSNTLGAPNPGQIVGYNSQYDEIGSDRTLWNPSVGNGVGNRYTASYSTTLLSFKQPLVLTGSGNVTIYLAEKVGGTYSIIFEKTYTGLADGGHILSSGPIGLPIVSGRDYAFMMTSTVTAAYPEDYDASGAPEHLSFGTFQGYVYSATGGSTTIGEYANNYALHQWIETSDGGILTPVTVLTQYLPDGYASTPYSQQLFATGGEGTITWSLASGSLPAGLTLSASGLISGNPTGNGVSSFTVRATDNVGQKADQPLTLQIWGTSSVTILTTSLPDALVGSPYPSQSLEGAGGTGSYAWSTTSYGGVCGGTLGLPPGLTFSIWGTITGTATTAGLYCFGARLQDGGGHVDTQDLTILVRFAASEGRWYRRGLADSELTAFAISVDTPNPTILVGTESNRLYKSVDDGASWAAMNIPVPGGERVLGIKDIEFGIDYSEGTVVGPATYVLMQTTVQSRLLRSTNRGVTWTEITPNATPVMDQIRVSPNPAQACKIVVFDANDANISVNCGNTWLRETKPGGAASSFAFADLEVSPDGRLFSIDANSNSLWEYATNYWALVATEGFTEIAVSRFFATDKTLFGIRKAPFGDIAVSHDGGHSWTGGIAVAGGVFQNLRLQPGYNHADPTRRNVYWIDTEVENGHVSGRLFRSPDGGTTVERVDSNQPSQFDAQGGGKPTMYPPLEIHAYFGSTGKLYHARSGFWMSPDEGVSWTPSRAPLNGVEATGVTRAADGTAFVATANGGFFKSADNGETFARFKIPSALEPGGLDPKIVAIRPSPTYDDRATGAPDKTIFVAGSEGLWRSNDGGLSWFSPGTLPWSTGIDPVSLFELCPNWNGTTGGRGTLVIGYKKAVYGGQTLYRSTDNGASWLLIGPQLNNGEVLWDFAFSPHFGIGSDQTAILSYFIPGADLDKGNGRGFLSTNMLASPPATSPSFTTKSTTFSGRVAFSPVYDENTGVAAPASQKTFWLGFKFTQDRGGSFSTRNIEPLCVDPDWEATESIYGVVRNNDGSALPGFFFSWDSGLSYNSAANPAITGLAVVGCEFLGGTGGSSASAATDGNGLYRTTDRGDNWTEVSTMTISLPDDVHGIATNPTNPLIFYAAVSSQRSGVYKSVDGGDTFFPSSNGLEVSGSPVSDFLSIFVCPSSPDTILAGSNGYGIFRSSNSGASWQRITSPAALQNGKFVDFDLDEVTGIITAANSSGVSYQASLASCGSSWSSATGPSDFVDFSSPQGGAPIPNRIARPILPDAGIRSAIWGVSDAGGARYQSDTASADKAGDTSPNALAWIDANGSGDYAFPYATCQGRAIQADTAGSVLLASCFDGIGGTKKNIYRSENAGTLGGDQWVGVDLFDPSNSGFASSARDVKTMTENALNADLLAGIDGVSNGGAYLSADKGKHWTVFNTGFDPNQLQLQDLISQDAYGNLYYHSGKPSDGLWSIKVAVDPTPVITSLAVPNGPESGNGNLGITGQYFKSGAVAEIGGVRCSSTAFIDSAHVTCTGIPPHFPGVAKVTVRNTDTRISNGFDYTYDALAPGQDVSLTTVAKSGANVILTWVDQLRVGNGYKVYRSLTVGFAGLVEVYPKGAESISCNGSTCTLTDSRFNPGTNGTTYYYRVE